MIDYRKLRPARRPNSYLLDQMEEGLVNIKEVPDLLDKSYNTMIRRIRYTGLKKYIYGPNIYLEQSEIYKLRDENYKECMTPEGRQEYEKTLAYVADYHAKRTDIHYHDKIKAKELNIDRIINGKHYKLVHGEIYSTDLYRYVGINRVKDITPITECIYYPHMESITKLRDQEAIHVYREVENE